VGAAAELVVDVRAGDPAVLHRRLAAIAEDGELIAVAITLAAMVPDDRPLRELLEWTDDLVPAVHLELSPPADESKCDPLADRSPAGARAEHGTRSRYNAGCRGAACLAADRQYGRDRADARKARRRRPATEPGEERRAS
jgi:hypothetical protein